MNQLKTLLILIAASIFYTSCNKNNDIKNPDPTTIDSTTIMGFKDSTQLIKSLSYISIDSFGNHIDSVILYFYYDTLNKKININTEYETSPIPSQYSVVLSYNNAGLIIQQKITDTNWISTTDYTYDAQNVISSETITDNIGVETFNLTKKDLPSGGYSLSTKSPLSDFILDSILYTYSFDATGKLILWNSLYFPTLNRFIDSTIYDESGNITKIIETKLYPGIPPSTYTLIEFGSRDTKGNQLYNLNNILYNGIASFVGSENYLELGGLFSGLNNFFYYQFTKYPSLNTTVYRDDKNSYLTFNPNPQYDSKNRLVKYKMYTAGNSNYYKEYDLNYYK